MSDLLYESQYFTTTLSVAGGIDASQTTSIVLQNVSGVSEPTKPGLCLLSYADPLDTTAAEWVTYTSVNTTTKELVGVTRGQEGSSGKIHLNGVAIAFPHSIAHINRINDKLTGVDPIVGATLTSPTVNTPTINGTITLDTDAQTSITNLGASSMSRQAIMNGDFQVAQRATTFVSGANNDDVYTLDRWNLISDGNDVFDVSQEATEVPDGAAYSIKLDVETAKRGGIVQFLENKDAKKFKGKSVSVSFSVKSANIAALRCAVLSWAGTADTLTSDVVGTWAATPTWAANWTAENTPADLTVTSDWTTVKVENIAIDSATVNNLALVIWTPNEETIGDIVYITNVQMNEGVVALPFQPKSFEEELRACQRYYYKIPGGTTYGVFATGQAISTSAANFFITFPVQMRTSPTSLVTTGNLSPSNGASSVQAAGSLALVSGTGSNKGYVVALTGSSGLTAGQGSMLYASNDTTASIGFEGAEL